MLNTSAREAVFAVLENVIRGLPNVPPVFRYKVKSLRTLSVLRHGDAAADPFKIIKVHPSEVKYYKPNTRAYLQSDDFVLKKWDDAGAVRAGEWDKKEHLIEIESSPKYRGIRERFEDGKEWRETDLYEYLLEAIQEQGSVDGCSSKRELDKRYREIDELYNDIVGEGYKPRSEIKSANTLKETLDEVCVSIGRDGELIFGGGGGWHRLSIAKLTGVQEIPVRVLLRHQKWQDIRREIATAESTEALSDPAERHLTHPDVQDVVQRI